MGNNKKTFFIILCIAVLIAGSVGAYYFVYKSYVSKLSVSLSNSKASNGNSLQTEPGFPTMERPELLPLWLSDGTQTKQISTYDTAGGNIDDGYHLNLRRYVDLNGDWVIFDEYGAGALYRMQMNVWNGGRIAPATRIKFYFDDETTPRLDMNMAGFFGKDQNYTAPFNPPLTFFDNLVSETLGSDRFAINYYPFPFKQRLKITMSPQDNGAIKWYQFTYLKFPNNNMVTSWQGITQDSPLVRSQWNSLGTDPKSLSGNVASSTTKNIPANSSATVFDIAGQGSISSLNLTMTPYNKDLFTKARIQIYWDNSNTPAVDMSLGAFFGGGGDTIGAKEDVYNKNFSNLFYGFNGISPTNGTFYSYWPMPFWSHARVVIVNNSNTDISSFVSDVQYKPATTLSYPQGQAGYFHAKRTIDVSPDSAFYSTAFEEQGRGKVVGLMFYSTGYSMDGDEFTYIDDSSTPQIHGDGTEDDHNQGWGGDAYQKPLWGGLVNGYQGGYRTYYNDSYIFNKNIKITYEHSNWPVVGASGQKTDAIVYYYKDAGGKSNLTLTDQLDIGNSGSENSHTYSIDRQTWSGSTDSNYDGYEQKLDYIHTIDNGRSNNGYSQFTVNIGPYNNGVKLRKRLDRYNNQIQKADVYVDGARVTENPWYIMDLNSDAGHAFIDSDFEIPPSYTQGKSSITVKIVYQDSKDTLKGISEYYYWVYSYGDPLTPACTLPATGVMTAPVSASVNSTFDVSCSYGSNQNYITVPGCDWKGANGGWIGNTAYFSCTAPATAQTKTYTCTPGIQNSPTDFCSIPAIVSKTVAIAIPATLPVTTTTPVTSITQTTATGGGNVTSNGGATVTVSGLVWSTTLNPTTANTKTTDGRAIGGPWTSNITGLTANTLYHVRAYATNSAGTSYGADVTFTTDLTKFGILYGAGTCIVDENNVAGFPVLNIAEILRGQGTWGGIPMLHWWDKPELGYYCISRNDNVLRAHAEMLRDAGIDFIIFDASNNETADYGDSDPTSGGHWTNEIVTKPLNRLLSVWSTIPGAPKIVPFFPLTTTGDMANYMVSKLNQNPNMAFIYKGKPLMLIVEGGPYVWSHVDQGKYDILSRNFTLRKYWTQNDTPSPAWSFMQTCLPDWKLFKSSGAGRPCDQRISTNSNGTLEQIPITPDFYVGPVSNQVWATPRFGGKTFVRQFETLFNHPDIEIATIFSWNDNWANLRLCLDGNGAITGDPAACKTEEYPDGSKIFVDGYTQEYSGDIEPSANEMGDYYYQLMKSCISKYRNGQMCDTNVAYTPFCTLPATGVMTAPASANTNSPFEVSCSYGSNQNYITVPGCDWKGANGGWIGNTAYFSCTAPSTAQNKTYTCTPRIQNSPTNFCSVPATVSKTVAIGASQISGDIDRNGRVDILDYNILVANFGKTGTNPADINGDSRVDIFDHNILVRNYEI